MRSVICHYHIYKNAGTSFDAILAASFGPAHLAFDGPFPFFTIDQEQLDRIITRRTDAVAFSSHQIQLPPPVSTAYRVIPVVFLRHPILRIASVWRFKRGGADGTRTARLASANDFADWLRLSFADPQEITQVSNAQTRLLSARHRERPHMVRLAGRVEYDLAQAIANLDQVACLGRAEHFAADVERFALHAARAGLPLDTRGHRHLNATERSADPAGVRVARLLESLPPGMAAQLVEANAQDQALYDLAGLRACDGPAEAVA